ncbi:MAG: DNA polymerase III subunit delta [Verrucomicrobia bacterium]|nr:DNA polymerase III subunit delta [Verrucomicrobiota bacterium]
MSAKSPAAARAAAPVTLLWGEDDFAVKQRARQLYQQACAEAGGFDHEIIDATVNNAGEALRALARLREALQTLPFFGSAKVIWLKDCNFFGDERAATAQLVTESLAELAEELKNFSWDNVRLLISAGKVDKRRTIYKTLEKLGTVEAFAAWSIEDKDWAFQAETAARRHLRERQKEIDDEALGALIESVGPNARQLTSEAEKLALYAGERAVITTEDVAAVVTRNRQARAFALADALGDRHLPRVLKTLSDELWSLKLDSQRSEIGLLYGLIGKVRVMIFLKSLMQEGRLKAEPNFGRFKEQLERLPADLLPEDKRFNPLAMNPYVLFKALPQTRNYTLAELVRAMELLLDCNRRLIFSNVDESLTLQQTLVEIVQAGGARPAAAAA